MVTGWSKLIIIKGVAGASKHTWMSYGRGVAKIPPAVVLFSERYRTIVFQGLF